MNKGESLGEERPKAPTATTLWCYPCLKNVCCCCKCCYNCCGCRKSGPPCPFCYFCFPCCCCCCRPAGVQKGVDEGETVVPPDDQGAALELAHEWQEEKAKQAEEVEEVEEAEEVYEVAEPSEPTKAAAKPKAKPRKQARPAGKKAPKSTPAFFTGKAAGLPPPPKEACTGPPPQVGEPSAPVGMGAYLVYTDAEGGKLKTQWSKTPLTGAGVLAYLRPEKEIGDYKFEKKSATEVHASDCQTCMTSEFPADRIKYYEGWATFFKQLSACGGSIVLLPAAGVEPPPKVKVIMFNKGKLTTAQVGQEIRLTSFDSLCIAPSNATKLDAKEMSLSEFMTLANSQGVYVSLKK